MSISATGAKVGTPASESLVLRIEETFYSLIQQSGVNVPPRQIATGKWANLQGFGNPPTFLGNQTVPAGTTTPVVAGRLVVQFVSGAAALVRQENTTNGISFPLEQLFTSAIAPPLNRLTRTYTFLVPVRITVAGTARVQVGLGGGTQMLDFIGTPPAAMWVSDPAVNAGRWLPRYRQTAAGAIVNGADSGIVASAWHLLGIRYVENATPRIEFSLDSLVRHTVSGDANMPPTFPAGTFYPGFVPSYGVFTPAGTTVQFGAASLEVRDV